MKSWKYGIVCVAICTLICASFTASAISVSDPTGDVQYVNENGYVGNVSDKPNIDITQLSAIVNGDSVTLSLMVSGTIEVSYNVTYWAWVNSTDTQYTVAVNHGIIMGMSMNRSTYVREFTNGSVTGTSNTVSAVFNITGSTSMVDLSALAKEGTLMSNATTRNFWYDEAVYVNTNNTTGTDTDNTTGTDTDNTTGTSPGKKTPGFELLPVIAAIAITAVLLRRRR